MKQRPAQTTITLDSDRHPAQRAALASLAGALGFGGNLSALIRFLADTAAAAPDETAAFLEAARDRATGGNEWSTLVILRDLLPPIALAAGDRLVTVDEVAAAVRADGNS